MHFNLVVVGQIFNKLHILRRGACQRVVLILILILMVQRLLEGEGFFGTALIRGNKLLITPSLLRTPFRKHINFFFSSISVRGRPRTFNRTHATFWNMCNLCLPSRCTSTSSLYYVSLKFRVVLSLNSVSYFTKCFLAFP